MTKLQPVPNDPAQLQEWLRSLPADQLRALTDGLVSPGSGLAATGPTAGFGEMENPRIELPPVPDGTGLLELDVRIVEAEPDIWRKLQVRGDVTLAELHPFLQAAFGWEDSHLHRFIPGPERFGAFFVTENDEDEGIDGTPETDVRLDQVLLEIGDILSYDYDFGDSWTHTIRLTGRSDLNVEAPPVRCTDGANQGPPEDVGGIHQYNQIAGWLRRGACDGDADEFDIDDPDQLRGWLPPGFDPDAFVLADVNRALELIARGDGGLLTAGVDLAEPLVSLIGRLDSWGQYQVAAWLGELETLDPSRPDIAAVETFVRPWTVFLEQIGDGVTLTAAGYLPPTVVAGIFTELGLADRWIGKGNREDLTPPVHSLRASARHLGLVRKHKGRLLPTKVGRRVGTDPAELWTQLVRSLPLGTDQVEQHAGWITLLGMAAGERSGAVIESARKMLWAIGWRLADGRPLNDRDAFAASRPTLDALYPVGQTFRESSSPEESAVVRQLARAAIDGR